ncbi:DUF58 domain-containing protein [Salinibacterium sp. SWN167]|uniref:DUF58 domain-containing protein n=1 Tax=Salinibacterium sp. SWN167 TaxID=2792054 RepID=UPI0018CC94D0|nr:DUF58 domain-containing protein [Salinibacterium sp. SWN167]MBH0082995.1 DUF58 domain-containing protein [Salinibacterium sp. SWN167]
MARDMMLRSIRIVMGGARLTNRGATFLVAGGVALGVGFGAGMPVLLYVGSFALALPMVAAFFVRRHAAAMTVTRRFSFPVVEAASTTAVTLRVDNQLRRATAAMRWRDGLPWHPWVTESGWLPRLSVKTGAGNDRSAAQLSYTLTPTARGVFDVGPLVVEASDPLQLAWGAWSVGAATPLIVTPQVVQFAPTALLAQSGDGEARVVQRRAAGDDDDAMTREYRRGDAMRRVHWKASARHGSLMVRQEEQHSYPQARIIVDTRLVGYPDASRAAAIRTPSGSAVAPAHSPRFEWVVSMLASAAVQLRREGFLVSIVETGQSQLTDAAVLHRRSAAEQELLTRLAAIAPIDSPAAWWTDSAARAATSVPTIALVANPDAETIDFLAAQTTGAGLAVAFVVESSSSFGDRERGGTEKRAPVTDQLSTAGWKVISVRSYDDVADAWNLLVSESKVLREHD